MAWTSLNRHSLFWTYSNGGGSSTKQLRVVSKFCFTQLWVKQIYEDNLNRKMSSMDYGICEAIKEYKRLGSYIRNKINVFHIHAKNVKWKKCHNLVNSSECKLFICPSTIKSIKKFTLILFQTINWIHKKTIFHSRK